MYWDFAKISQIEECSFNAVLKKFGELGIDGLVRENIQNSLDGKDTTLVAKVVGTDYPFVIDQNLGLIYNLDSLPVGTDISKIVAKITADGTIFIAAETDSIWEEAYPTRHPCPPQPCRRQN